MRAGQVRRNDWIDPLLRDRWLAVAIGVLAVPVFLAFLCDVLTLWQRYPTDLNSEGWNAYDAALAVTAPARLYPPAGSLWFNNYPPLSYFVVGILGRAFGDNIVAGRFVSLVAAAAAALAIAAAARGMGCGRREQAFASLVFLASPWVLSKFAGADDPQMLGQAIGCAGFALIVSNPRRDGAIVAGTLLLVLAEFVKPLFVDQPIALLLWLGLYARRSALVLALSGLGFGLVGLSATDLGLGTNLLHHLLLPRVYTPSRIMAHPGQWLVSGFLPLSATLSLFRNRRDEPAILCGIYSVVAFAFSLLFCGGEGVGGNPTIDLSIATALGLVVFVNRAENAFVVPGSTEARLARLVPFASAALLSGVLLAAGFAGWDSGLPMMDRLKKQEGVDRDIAYLAERRGPALCEAVALCYWAGKTREVDLWSLSQALELRVTGADAIFPLVRERHFRTVQLDKKPPPWFPPSLRAEILRNYRAVHIDANMDFFVPARRGT